MTAYTDIVGLLACPRCERPLEVLDDTALACTSTACEFHARPFVIRDGCPVLVDFERSILDEAAVLQRPATSPVSRRTSNWQRRVRDALFGTNRVAPRAARAMLAHPSLQGGTAPPSLLVVGGATVGSGAEALYESPAVRLISFDIYRSPRTTFLADAHRIPLGDATVDAVWIQAVLEHVLDPPVVVQQIWRVLKPGGLVYAETPFLQQVHEGPYDFTRFTHSGHRWLFRHFAELDSGVVAGPGTQSAWTVEHLARSVFRSFAVGKLVKAAVFWLRFLDRAAGPAQSLDAASAVYFLGTKAARPIHVKDMVSYYRGAAR